MTGASILFLLAAVGSQDVVPSEQLPESTITVSAERLRDFRGRWHLPEAGSATCEIRRSTGDDELDQLACAAIIQCVDENLSTIARGRDRSLPRDERRAATAQTRETMRACSAERLTDLEERLSV
ncbi:hypothetical protein [Aurantiacibacter sp. MUD61]|uniref:hypothetical protein n=1 Tax=Aurantiacibacter sp. MUD61 TaxID=3009083 RepID=UPI0022F07ADB|nr:hypothetical protein [Aurantiacibacter sp. MUD61]